MNGLRITGYVSGGILLAVGVLAVLIAWLTGGSIYQVALAGSIVLAGASLLGTCLLTAIIGRLDQLHDVAQRTAASATATATATRQQAERQAAAGQARVNAILAGDRSADGT